MSYEPYTPHQQQRIKGLGEDQKRAHFAHYQASPTADAADALHAAVTDDSTLQVILDAITDPNDLVANDDITGGTQVVTATAGGTAGDIKAIQVHVYGTNAADANIDEELPAFTVNTAGTVTGALAFKTITKIIIPAHDGTGATTSVGVAGDVDAILPAETDQGVTLTITELDAQPDVPRCISATAGGTAGDVKAIQVGLTGTDVAGSTITEDLPAFTVNTPGAVTGAKAFATITRVEIPVHDGNGATTSIGDSDILGLYHKLARNTVVKTYLNNALEGTAPTVAVSATVPASNTIDLNSALDGNQVDCYYLVDADNI